MSVDLMASKREIIERGARGIWETECSECIRRLPLKDISTAWAQMETEKRDRYIRMARAAFDAFAENLANPTERRGGDGY